jgi:uncharacterized protein YmfQ (DUF2313 family)
MDQFSQSLSALLPRGYAWPRHPDSVLMRVMDGLSASHRELYEFTLSTVQQWLPQTTGTRLAEWESATGLPDLCFGFNQSLESRRSMLMERLRGVQGEYEDSCPGSPAAIASSIEAMGHSAAVVYNKPMRVGRSRVGGRLGALDGRLHVTVTLGTAALPFRVGRSRVGSPLVDLSDQGNLISCFLKRIVPARFEINLVFEGA